ncbi:SMP-30/gluconolactonase/LRE family protein [Caldimonas tepidiphila]|uniref:SMP-30/gluconolactonase/LRE family protein n=1 Tax=Caldimonas tepidiphila TaxID=2315841 RepID=UPI000E5AD39B|nr:SMP-30/gluconolactonase/LRE family protein [Caldimonas tepidiphila]
MVADTTFGTDALILPGLRNGTGESPVWDTLSRRWLWVDIPAGAVQRFDPDSGTLERFQLPEKVGCLVLRPGGGLLCACESGLFEVDLPDAGGGDAAPQVRRVAEVAHPQPGMRFNDGRCDRQGRLWASTMLMDLDRIRPVGRWYRYTPAEGLQETSVGGLMIANGSAFSPDGRTFYCSDSHRDVRMVWAHDYDPDTGTAHNRRVFVDMREMVGRPDGATVDADGCYWVCCIDEGCIKRFTPDGRLDRRLYVPMCKPTMCAFGGDDMGTLFVTSLSRGEADLAVDPHGGRVLMCRPGVQGLPEPRLAAA